MTGRLRQPHPSRRARLRLLPLGCLVLAGGLLLPGRTGAREVRITLLHTADVRGHVEPLRFREWDRHHGGLLRCASLVEQIRAEERNVLLLDAGGLVRGSPESYLSAGLLPLKAAACMGYHARVPSPAAAEPGDTASPGAAGFPSVPAVAADALPGPARAFRVFRLDGVVIAVIGLRADADGDPAASLARFEQVVRDVRAERPHLIVLLAHLSHDPRKDAGSSLLHQIMMRYPDLHLVIGGGSDRATRAARVGRTLYAECGPEGRWLGRVDLVYDTVRRECTSATSDLLEVGPGVPVSTALRSALGASLGRIERALDREVGSSARRVRASAPSTPGQSEMQELISRAMAAEAGADVVLLATAGLGGLPQGTLRWRDVIRAVPEATSMVSISVPAVGLRRILAENLAHVNDAAFLGIHGARYAWAEDAEGRAEVHGLVLQDGSPPHGRRRLLVAFLPHLLDAPGREVLGEIAREPTSRLEVRPVDLRSLVAAYIETHGVDDLKPEAGSAGR